jgi:hypothetical protein
MRTKFSFGKLTKKTQFEGRENRQVIGINFFRKICYKERMCMEQDQNCVLPETSSGELKLRVPKLSFFE